jgi:hypothetical protein
MFRRKSGNDLKKFIKTPCQLAAQGGFALLSRPARHIST